ncbi:hypothetical protein LFWB_0150 [Candidatus Phytoplasma luffae]|uniref:Uncharacterized protein n=1 Tax=Loofah witches'-broom phytoplasma TaxID=35773 RepID=A0A975ILQ8_LOWBP|nr:hypothetical protein [Candidatus Phytoplasma luffae]QTX02585.1 hypothetical protein LFWB_0150 [Candidatus Phytoplasma luffae]
MINKKKINICIYLYLICFFIFFLFKINQILADNKKLQDIIPDDKKTIHIDASKKHDKNEILKIIKTIDQSLNKLTVDSLTIEDNKVKIKVTQEQSQQNNIVAGEIELTLKDDAKKADNKVPQKQNENSNQNNEDKTLIIIILIVIIITIIGYYYYDKKRKSE